ncbi:MULTISPECIES: element excision factor XisH family protein [Okeania]|uniref:Fatty-acid synthase n=2 Tax=Okeania TaxID=1458928 RepID=A0A3N6Q2L5_9CYAN|nr:MULTISPECIES: element excision factor XisH family protein [Okeania]NEP88547.1 fatty-acid synthase [Okeania sp. SIO2C2]NES78804.1 fatty-acid synthase [Okeania sp. SIO1H4]NET22433.1 fatty-acid synthase [Okeania sp. SIO1H5]NET79209.1 fatty-acid synthase [Okeania sp. SIO1F9]NET97348.1 fatty-acid synthase [Okeania sp. SIO1H2]
MAKDIYHQIVKTALVKDGWTITDDPLRLQFGSRTLYADLGAKKLLAAQKEGQRIAVEIKSFLGVSPIKDLEQALGQYIIYAQILSQQAPERLLYMAIPQSVFSDFFSEELPKFVVKFNQVKLLIFQPETEEVVQWIT